MHTETHKIKNIQYDSVTGFCRVLFNGGHWDIRDIKSDGEVPSVGDKITLYFENEFKFIGYPVRAEITNKRRI